MLKWAVGQRNPTPGPQLSSCYSSASGQGGSDSSCFQTSTTSDRLHVARRRNSRGAVRKAAIRSLRRTKENKENQPCLTPENVSSRIRDNSGFNQMALRDVSNSPDPYMVTPKCHEYVKRRQSHPLNLIRKRSNSEYSKSAPTNTLEYLKTYESTAQCQPVTSYTSYKLPKPTTSHRTPSQVRRRTGHLCPDVTDVVDMRQPNSTLKSLLTMQIEYSPGPLTATQSLVTLRQRLTKSLSGGVTPQSIDNPLYCALNATNNGITLSCNEPSPNLDGLMEEKSILDQVTDKFDYNFKKDSSRLESTVVSSLSERLEWLRLNNSFNTVNLLKEGGGDGDEDDVDGGVDDFITKKKKRMSFSMNGDRGGWMDDVDGSRDDHGNDEAEDGGSGRRRRDWDVLRRQKSVRRKSRKCCDGACKTGYGSCCDKYKPKTQPRPKLMGLTLPLGIPSPVTSEDSSLCSLGLEGIHPLSSSPIKKDDPGTLTEEGLAKLRQGGHNESIATSLIVEKCSPSSICSSLRKRVNGDGFEGRDAWSEEVVPLVKTPKLSDQPRFKEEEPGASFNCDFVLPSPLALVEKRSRSRRCLRFVSPGSSNTCQRHLSAKHPLSLSCPRLRDGREGAGELELSVSIVKDLITIHVGRGTGLSRPSGPGCNPYVKVALVPSTERTFFRTPVHRESTCPNFNENFTFPFHPEDLGKQILVSVWHRDRDNRKSEFLGCVSLAVKNAIKKEISGWFRLVAQSGGSKASTQQQQRSSVQSGVGPAAPGLQQCMMARRSGNARLDDVITFDEEPHSSPEKTCKTPVRKRLNDDSTFLRHLELEPMDGEGGRGPLPEAIAKGGRTPFTTTKQLTKQPGGGFGFSIAWVQPPRVERVEAGQPADRAGIRPGDSVVFVDRYNVVTMSEEQILQIIKSCGNELTLEIYRKSNPNGVVTEAAAAPQPPPQSALPCSAPASAPAPAECNRSNARWSAACSAATSNSIDFTKRRLHLPQVAFTNETAQLNPEESRKKAIYQLLSKEQNYAVNLQFGINRFLVPLAERREFLNAKQHHVLFQNVEEILRLTEDTIDQAINEEIDIVGNFVGRLYFKRIASLKTAYRRYCAGIKRADCLLAEKSKNNEFNRFCVEPPIPRKRPDLTTFLHKPLEHYRELLKLLQTVLNLTKSSDADHVALTKVVNDMQTSFRDVTGGLMEPEVEGRPLLSVQDLESRLVFTRCKPFVLSIPGRQWIFGGDLSRIEGRSVHPFWALLFTDMMVFAKVSRDRVLFITEEPLSLLAVSQAFFNIRKKANEFRLLLSSTGTGTDSPANAMCGPDIVLSRTPKKNTKFRSIALRAPTPELKAVWQNLIQRQIIYLNTTRGLTPASSPLESPDPPTTMSAATLDSVSLKRQVGSQDAKNKRIGVDDIVNQDNSSNRQFNDFIDQKCRQLSKMTTSKDGALHLAEWMKDNLGNSKQGTGTTFTEGRPREDPYRKTSYQTTESSVRKSTNARQDWLLEKSPPKNSEPEHSHNPHHLHHHHSHNHHQQQQQEQPQQPHQPNQSQVSSTNSSVKFGRQERTMSVCRDCHKNCLNTDDKGGGGDRRVTKDRVDDGDGDGDDEDEDDDCGDNWGSLMMLGICGILPAIKNSADPFAPTEAPPSISVLPPTPDRKKQTSNADGVRNSPVGGRDKTSKCRSGDSASGGGGGSGSDRSAGVGGGGDSSSSISGSGAGAGKTVSSAMARETFFSSSFNTQKPQILITKLIDPNADNDTSESRATQKTLSSPSGLRRYGTLTSLEKVTSDEPLNKDGFAEAGDVNRKPEDDAEDKIVVKSHPPEVGDSIRGWTVRAGSFVAAKMAFFERLSSPDNSVTIRKTTFLERYLKPSGENSLESPDLGTNTSSSGRADDEGETSGATSGEEVWGTPTSGGDYDEDGAGESSALSCFESPRSSIGASDDTEQLMDDLMRSLPMLAVRGHGGLPPRRRLEPLLEEDDSECSSPPCSPPPVHITFKPGEGRALRSALKQPRDNTLGVAAADSKHHQQQQQQRQLSVRLNPTNRSQTGTTDGPLLTKADDREKAIDSTTTTTTTAPATTTTTTTTTTTAASSIFRRFGLRRNGRGRHQSDSGSRKGNRILGFLSGKRSGTGLVNRSSATYGAKPLFRYLFNKDSDDDDDDIPTTLPRGFNPHSRGEKRLEKRFWKQLRRRNSNSAVPVVRFMS